MSTVPPSERARVKRAHFRANYDREMVISILDAGVLCHVGYVYDDYPVVTPTIYYRDGEYVYWHGANSGRAIRYSGDAQVCFTVTHLDGLVLSRSGFYHSANFRSVMIFGAPEIVDADETSDKLKTMINDLYGDRWDQLRPATAQELKATRVLRLRIDEASAKIRTGPPMDDAGDLDTPVWAGVFPVKTVYGPAESDELATAKGFTPPTLNPRLRGDGA